MRYFTTLILVMICINIDAQITAPSVITENDRQFRLPYNRLIQPAGQQIVFGDESR